LRPPAAITLLALALVALSQGCGEGEAREGPPFEPGNIETPDSLLITQGDIAEVGPSTPYGSVLRWWSALQQANVDGVRRSYVVRIRSGEARRQIFNFQPRLSQPIRPGVTVHGNRATMNVVVRTAIPLPAATSIFRVVDFPTRFDLLRKAAEWKIEASSYRNFIDDRPFPRQPGG
jgi:hypothetical protein